MEVRGVPVAARGAMRKSSFRWFRDPAHATLRLFQALRGGGRSCRLLRRGTTLATVGHKGELVSLRLPPVSLTGWPCFCTVRGPVARQGCRRGMTGGGSTCVWVWFPACSSWRQRARGGRTQPALRLQTMQSRARRRRRHARARTRQPASDLSRCIKGAPTERFHALTPCGAGNSNSPSPISTAPASYPTIFPRRMGSAADHVRPECAVSEPGFALPSVTSSWWVSPSSARSMARGSTGVPLSVAEEIPRQRRSGFVTWMS